MVLQAPEHLPSIWIAAGLALAALVAAGARRRAVSRLADDRLAPRLRAEVRGSARAACALLTLLAASLIGVALARPGWDPQPRPTIRVGRDVVFLVDVSRSMLAEDLRPNRLERARIAIADTLRTIEGDRVALVAFGGTSSVKCPLTLDRAFFRMTLDTLSTDSVTRGGTAIGDAIRCALDEVFDLDEERNRDIILITDGEDHDSFPVDAAARAGEAGVRIIAVGLGDEDDGTTIPTTDRQGRPALVTYEGETVRSRLNADLLRQVVRASKDGVYFNVSTGNINLDEVYASLITGAERSAIDEQTGLRYREAFPYLLGGAAACLLAAFAIGDGRRSA